jgi:hypothetical protein
VLGGSLAPATHWRRSYAFGEENRAQHRQWAQATPKRGPDDGRTSLARYEHHFPDLLDLAGLSLGENDRDAPRKAASVLSV